MSLSVEDRQKLTDILEANRRTGTEIGPPIGDDHEVAVAVRDTVDRFEEERRMEFMSRDIAELTGHKAQLIGMVLSKMRQRGRVEAARPSSPTIWRING